MQEKWYFFLRWGLFFAFFLAQPFKMPARSSASVPRAGSLAANRGEVVSHDMGGHIAAAVIDEQAGHIFAQWVLNPTLRIPRFIRHQSPGSEQTRSGLALSEVWRRHHRSPTPLAIAFICEPQPDLIFRLTRTS